MTEQLEDVLNRCPLVAAKTITAEQKAVLQRFCEFASCDVAFACELIEGILSQLDNGKKVVYFNCGWYKKGQWPRNDAACVLGALAIFTQPECLLARRQYLDSVHAFGIDNQDRVYFRRLQPLGF